MAQLRTVPAIARSLPWEEYPVALDVPFGALLRRHRHAAGWTQEDLAERANLSVRAIAELERDTSRVPQHETLRLLIEALSLTPAEQNTFEAAARRRRAPIAIAPADHATKAPQNLPAPVTPLIGREDALCTVTALLRGPAVRLVTVTGAGGVGKTRLALATASVVQTDFPDGVIFVPLAAVRDPALLVPTIAHVLGAPERRGQPLRDRLVAYIGTQRLLLVLDNFEQILPAAVDLADVLAACRGLTILVTSRAPLEIRGEHVYRLAPLAVPDLAGPMDTESLAQIPAVTLFVQRVQSIEHGFRLTPENAAAVAAICARLDGLPLALELAAARTRLLTPAALLARLEHRLPLLVSGPRDLPARQQTLRATLDWSHDLLTEPERTVFRRLAVFVSGWTLATAEAVCDTDGALAGHVLDVLESLVAKHLISVETVGASSRFSMLETIREYALECLTVSSEEESVQQAHAATYRRLITGAEQALTGPGQTAVAARLETEAENLRAAMHWTIRHGESAWACCFGWELWRYWLARGAYTEGRAWLAAFLALDGAGDSPRYGHILLAAGALAVDQRDHAAASAHLERALAAGRSSRDRALVASVLAQRGRLAWQHGDLAAARAHCAASLQIRRSLGAPWPVAVALQLIGRVTLEQGDMIAARTHLEEGLRLAREIGDGSLLANVLRDLGELALLERDDTRAGRLFDASLARYRGVGHPWSMARCLDALAEVALRQQHPDRAAQLLGEAAALRETIATSLTPADDSRGTRLIAGARAALGDAAFAAAWQTGANMAAEMIAPARVAHVG